MHKGTILFLFCKSLSALGLARAGGQLAAPNWGGAYGFTPYITRSVYALALALPLIKRAL